MQKLSKKRDINFLAFLFSVTYMVSYITRINYGAVIVAMQSDTGFSESLLSLAVTGSFVTYGVGQIISGALGDRISPKRLVTYGLCLTVLMNVLIPFCPNPYLLAGVWCVNGFAQSLMWPPIVRLMTMLLSAEDYKNTTAKVVWGGNIGTIVIYLLAPIIVSLLGWKSVFWFAALCGALMMIFWNKYSFEVGVQKREKVSGEVSIDKKYNLFTPLMIFIMIAIILQGSLRDGIATWMPSYIKTSYDLGDAISILTGVVLPIFAIICIQLATKIYVKKFTNPITCAALLFGIGTVSAVGIYFLSGVSIISSVALFAILSGCMHGVNLLLVCMVPQFFEKSGKVSTVSGVINSCTYIGSAISTYGIAFLSEQKGWDFTLGTLVVIAALGTGICLICKNAWKKRFE
ncbi:MAG: MFS transporter [Clostridia bacterium]|nr:MFS transporter [Clostridia bacterium]